MKWVRLAACALVLAGLVLVLGPADEARAACKTQGELALALAQMLKFEVGSQETALAKLASIGVGPSDGWKPAQCLSDEVVIQIEESLRNAVVLKFVDADLALGAVARALTAIGAPEFIPALDRASHFLPTRGGTDRGRTVSSQGEVIPVVPVVPVVPSGGGPRDEPGGGSEVSPFRPSP